MQKFCVKICCVNVVITTDTIYNLIITMIY